MVGERALLTQTNTQHAPLRSVTTGSLPALPCKPFTLSLTLTAVLRVRAGTNASAEASAQGSRVSQRVPRPKAGGGDYDGPCGPVGSFLMWVGPRLLIAPGSRFRTLWDTFSIVLIIYLAAVLPYRIAFVKEWSVAHAVFDFIIDLYFISDIDAMYASAAHSHTDPSLSTLHLVLSPRAHQSLFPPLP